MARRKSIVAVVFIGFKVREAVGKEASGQWQLIATDLTGWVKKTEVSLRAGEA